MMSDSVSNRKLPVIVIAGAWLAVILIFALTAIISYQGMSLVSFYEEAGPLSSALYEINPVLFWAGRILGVLCTLAVWFFTLRKGFVQRLSNGKTGLFAVEIIITVCVAFISWFTSTVAVFISTGFIDIQPEWADNAYIVNFPVYVFGIIAIMDTVIIGIRRVSAKR